MFLNIPELYSTVILNLFGAHEIVWNFCQHLVYTNENESVERNIRQKDQYKNIQYLFLKKLAKKSYVLSEFLAKLKSKNFKHTKETSPAAPKHSGTRSSWKKAPLIDIPFAFLVDVILWETFCILEFVFCDYNFRISAPYNVYH